MISSTLIPNSLYNSLPTIMQQSPPSDAHLEGLGALLVSHGVHNHLGISLLHRHYVLKDDAVMVHDGLRCSPVAPAATPSSLGGASFFLHDGSFQAFEYEQEDEEADIPSAFLEDLARYLVANGLEKNIALSKLGDPDAPLLTEYCEGESHVCEVAEGEMSAEEATMWKFLPLGGFVVPKVMQTCHRTASSNDGPRGEHKKKP